MDPLGLYLHVPFCRAKCAYCDFSSYPHLEHLHERYVAALCQELTLAAEECRPLDVDSIYIGGGTPSTLPPALLCQVLAKCRQAFAVSADAEISLEANPGTLQPDALTALLRAGVNRLSLGAQSFNDHELRLLGRIHGAEQTREAVRLARRAGLRNLNLDLIYGLPNQNLAEWGASLEQAVQLAPEHLSAYALSVEEGTPLAGRIARGELPAPDPDLVADMYEQAEQCLERAGYEHYEISNWALRAATGCASPFRCRHNGKYWHVEPYLGFGAGAHSHWHGERWSNVLHPLEYVTRIEQRMSAVAERTPIPSADSMAESMMLGLRLMEGVDLQAFARRYGCDLLRVYAAPIAELEALGLLEHDDCSVRLTPRGHLLGNQVFGRFWPPPAPQRTGP